MVTKDNKYIVSGSGSHGNNCDKSIRVWNISENTQETVLEGDTGYINSLAITNDNKYIVSGSNDNTVRI